MTRESVLAALLVSERTGIAVVDILGRDRKRAVAHARQDVWRVVRDTYGMKLEAIASDFGRDHTTILYGIRKSRKREAQP